jgi:hypothetical protein
MKALQILAGPVALKRLRERGLQPDDIRAIPAAAGGPKGLILNPLDRFVFGQWLPRSAQVVHLLGASIGAWRMASACLPDADAALKTLADDYIAQRYEHEPGKAPRPRHVSDLFEAKLVERFGGREHEVLSHPRFRLHVFTSRGVRALARDGRVRTPLGYLGAFATNAVSRRAMGGFLERVIFSDPRDRLPVPTHDYRTRHVTLSAANLCRSILASCTIPFWLDAVDAIPGAPPGPYWDGGITDYHLHLDYAALHGDESVSEGAGLVLYPHFQKTLVPGWLDKALRHRHRASARLANVVLLSPSPEWVATLPGGKIPDRSDFKAFGDDHDARARAWTRATEESVRLAEEFEVLTRAGSIEAMPLP